MYSTFADTLLPQVASVQRLRAWSGNYKVNRYTGKHVQHFTCLPVYLFTWMPIRGSDRTPFESRSAHSGRLVRANAAHLSGARRVSFLPAARAGMTPVPGCNQSQSPGRCNG